MNVSLSDENSPYEYGTIGATVWPTVLVCCTLLHRASCRQHAVSSQSQVNHSCDFDIHKDSFLGYIIVLSDLPI